MMGICLQESRPVMPRSGPDEEESKSAVREA